MSRSRQRELNGRRGMGVRARTNDGPGAATAHLARAIDTGRGSPPGADMDIARRIPEHQPPGGSACSVASLDYLLTAGPSCCASDREPPGESSTEEASSCS